MLQLRHGYENAALRVPNTLKALGKVRSAGALSATDCDYLIESYTFLRRVESRLRLLHAAARNDLPEDATELATVARGLGLPGGETLAERCSQYLAENRRRFEAFFRA
jgi:glutamate-ammonia-ligase adenylyltransferase